jgi:basic membrane lipoprotein Med (substrate-binding protein (PBP1-ABC) superfamily)
VQLEEHRILLLALRSVQKASRDLDLELLHAETPPDGQAADTARSLLDQGYQAVVAIWWDDPDPLWQLAREHPDVRFFYFGHPGGEELSNLASFVFPMEDAGFLAGALAGKASDRKRVAVIAGPQVPVIEQLVSGFERGVAYACPQCEAIVYRADSFDDERLGEELGVRAVAEGADVVFNAAGGLGSVAIRAAAQQGAWVIGVDEDEYRTTFEGGGVPNADRLLASAVRRIDRVAYQVIAALARGEFQSGSYTLGAANGGIELTTSHRPSHPRWPELQTFLQATIEALRSGTLHP